MMKVFKIVFLICGLVMTIISCKKDHRVLSSAVQPENDELLTLPGQRYDVYAHTIYYKDAIVSLNDNLKYIGSNVDANFGTTTIGLYLNADLQETLNFDPSTVFISAELVFTTNKRSTGLKPTPLTYSVFTVDSVLSPKRSYFVDQKNLHDPNHLIGQTTTAVDTFLRLPLDPVYGEAMFRDKNNLNVDSFTTAYKGFYILASSNGAKGVIMECDLDHSQSGIVFTYKQDVNSEKKIYRIPFSGPKSVKFNTLTFTPGSDMAAQLAGDTTLGADKSYLRGMGATRMRVHIPFLTNLSDSFSYAVNRAEVVFFIDPSYLPIDPDDKGHGEQYKAPEKIALMAADINGKEDLASDQFTKTDVIRYDAKGYKDGFGRVYKYVFNIPLHAQKILNGTKKNYGFYLVMANPEPPITARRDNYIERLVFAGHGRGDDLKPQFNISYTRVGKY